MKHYALLLCLLFTICAQAQTEDETAAKKAVMHFFEGFHKKDSVLMQQVVHKNLVLQTAFTNPKGEAVLRNQDTDGFIHAVMSRAARPEWQEKILSYHVQVDGIMANVWTPYEFWLDGKFLHCGVNSFQLFKENGKWKIIYLIDTRRKKGCRE